MNRAALLHLSEILRDIEQSRPVGAKPDRLESSGGDGRQKAYATDGGDLVLASKELDYALKLLSSKGLRDDIEWLPDVGAAISNANRVLKNMAAQLMQNEVACS